MADITYSGCMMADITYSDCMKLVPTTTHAHASVEN